MNPQTAYRAFSLALLGVIGGCSKQQAVLSSRGTWGGEHIAMTVTDSGATVEYDCARGSIDEPLRADAAGTFSARGVHINLHGGPAVVDEPVDRHPASYTGTSDGTTMSLRVRLTDSGDSLGPFLLRRDATPRLYRCL